MVANFSPYIAPVPSAFFVARASILHLEIPLIVGIIVGVVIETLGFSSVHTWLLLTDWNTKSRKTDAKAPAKYALLLVIFYLIVTVSLTVGLEIIPHLAVYTPAIFPCLALIGAVNLILIAQQEQRELDVKIVQLERSEKRRLSTNSSVQKDGNKSSNLANLDNNLNKANEARKRNKTTNLNTIKAIISEHPNIGVTELKNATGIRSRTTVYNYLEELRKNGKLSTNLPVEN
jgi:hypothetical protein